MLVQACCVAAAAHANVRSALRRVKRASGARCGVAANTSMRDLVSLGRQPMQHAACETSAKQDAAVAGSNGAIQPSIWASSSKRAPEGNRLSVAKSVPWNAMGFASLRGGRPARFLVGTTHEHRTLVVAAASRIAAL